MRTESSLVRTVTGTLLPRDLHLASCAAILGCVTWALLSPDPYAVVSPGTMSWVRGVDDSIVHATVFCVLTASVVSLAIRMAGFLPMTVIVALVAYAIATELIQGMVPGRMCDPLDAAANAAGIVAGTLLVYLVMTNLDRRTA